MQVSINNYQSVLGSSMGANISSQPPPPPPPQGIGQANELSLSDSAANALAELEAFAEEQGVTVEELIDQHMAEQNQGGQGMRGMAEMGGMPPPPPKDEMSDFFAANMDDADVQAFMEEVKTMSESGEFDAEALADSAPDSMKAYAEKNGIDLISFFSDKQAQFESRASQPPPPPPGQFSSQTNLYSLIESSDNNTQSNNMTELVLQALSISEVA